MTYSAIFFVVFHLYIINDHTMQLALQIETVREIVSRANNNKDIEKDIGEVGDQDEVIFASIPRKITLFRCVMEKKLGIDWEHSV